MIDIHMIYAARTGQLAVFRYRFDALIAALQESGHFFHNCMIHLTARFHLPHAKRRGTRTSMVEGEKKRKEEIRYFTFLCEYVIVLIGCTGALCTAINCAHTQLQIFCKYFLKQIPAHSFACVSPSNGRNHQRQRFDKPTYLI